MGQRKADVPDDHPVSPQRVVVGDDDDDFPAPGASKMVRSLQFMCSGGWHGAATRARAAALTVDLPVRSLRPLAAGPWPLQPRAQSESLLLTQLLLALKTTRTCFPSLLTKRSPSQTRKVRLVYEPTLSCPVCPAEQPLPGCRGNTLCPCCIPAGGSSRSKSPFGDSDDDKPASRFKASTASHSSCMLGLLQCAVQPAQPRSVTVATTPALALACAHAGPLRRR